MSKICPLCEKELKHQGALNMHMYHCKMKKEWKAEVDQGENCEHGWRLLSIDSPIEKKAHLNGYMEVCRKCQELR